MLGYLEIYKALYLMKLEEAAVKREHEDTAAKIRTRLAALDASIYERRRLDYAREFVGRNVQRAESRSNSFNEWISIRTTRAAMQVILDRMSDLVLLDFVAPFATTSNVTEYIRDKELELCSSCEPPVWSHGGEKKRGFVEGFVYGWRTSFPTVVRFRHDTLTQAELHELRAILGGQYGPLPTTLS